MNVDSADVFVLARRQTVLLRLPSFDWDFTLGLRVHLRCNALHLDMRQVGTGNHEGRATILLSPAGEWSDAEPIARAMLECGTLTVTVAGS